MENNSSPPNNKSQDNANTMTERLVNKVTEGFTGSGAPYVFGTVVLITVFVFVGYVAKDINNGVLAKIDDIYKEQKQANINSEKIQVKLESNQRDLLNLKEQQLKIERLQAEQEKRLYRIESKKNY
ncbi:hypothetical protein [Silvanigrella sp.]|jgi:hypothetical protein|uniref:hypothetical protein n=1 Tax=Silvanigrella sp. TaxID=2024976 RepID=UPI0037C7BD1A